jgi:putative ABC transport system permease protein
MVISYLKLAFRNIRKNIVLSAVNITGLAVGICCVLLAILYWIDERSYDKFHKNNPNLFRITTNLVENRGDKPVITGGTGQVQGPAFKAQVPEIKEYVRLLGGGISADYRNSEKLLKLKLLFADETFFDVFSFQLIHGNSATALKELNSVVITEEAALKFFNTTDVVGQELNMEADPSAQQLGKPLLITGVVKDLSKHSSIQFEILHPFRFLQLSFEDKNWLNAYLGTFVVLHPQADRDAVVKKFNQVYARNASEQLKAQGHDPGISYGLQPVTDMHLNSYSVKGNTVEAGVLNGSNPLYSYFFLGIASFIFLMAAINFINISIAGSLNRIKEVGVRKITGSSTFQIMVQFVGEAAVVCTLAFALAIVLMHAVLPLFNFLADKQIALHDFNGWLVPAFLLLLLCNILLTSLYPAYVLSRFKPIEALYNKHKLIGKSTLSGGLIVIQFSLSVFLIVASIVFYTQMRFIKTKDLGYNPHQVIRTEIAGNRAYHHVQEFLENEIAKEPSLIRISFGGEAGTYHTAVNNITLKSTYRRADKNHLETLGIQLKAGNNFLHDSSDEAIVNEAFVKKAGLKDPIGEIIKPDFHERPLTIAGVVKDFHFGSLKERIEPMVLFQQAENSGAIWIKFDQSQQKKALASIELLYKKAIPDAIYEYSFLDELNAKEYEQEQRWEKIIGIATFLSLFICCLGLFGLTRLATEQKIKEIGIRKVLGASVIQIASLLSKEFVKLVVLAIVIVTPFGWWATNKWLQNFAYRIDVGWWVFGLAGTIAIFMALFTVSFQAVKAAVANPVKSLRTE